MMQLDQVTSRLVDMVVSQDTQMETQDTQQEMLKQQQLQNIRNSEWVLWYFIENKLYLMKKMNLELIKIDILKLNVILDVVGTYY